MTYSTTMAHNSSHQIATYKYKDKLLFTANFKDIDLDNSKYTISFNKDKTRAWHFFTSKEVFLKWETANDGPHAVDLEVKDGINWKEDINGIKVVYTPIEVKEKQN